MRNTFILFILVFIFSCGEKKVVKLPEISHSDITELQDVSAAYLFYNETQPDSVELNRKNLISTTNWLINIDKRLTLKQVIPHIKFLQDKKANGTHKNENAKNYFTCHDTNRNSLGFVEFTDIDYQNDIYDLYKRKDITASKNKHEAIAHIFNLDSINIHYPDHEYINTGSTIYSNKNNLLIDLPKIKDSANVVLYLSFKSNCTFQDYISIKSELSQLNIENILISNHEFIIDSL